MTNPPSSLIHHSLLKMFFLFLLFFGSHRSFKLHNFLLSALSLNSSFTPSLLRPAVHFSSSNLPFQECQRTPFLLSLRPPGSVYRQLTPTDIKMKQSLWFHGSVLHNWSLSLYIGQTVCKINCLPQWGWTRKTGYQKAFCSQRKCFGKV